MKELKRISPISLILIFVLSIFIPIFPIEVKASNAPYRVVMVNSSGNNTHIGYYSTYNSALTAANQQNSTDTSVATIYLNETKIVYAKYGLARVNVSKESTIPVWQDNSQQYSYLSPTSATDATFLNYDFSYGTFEILISGLRGWVRSTDAEIVPLSLLNKKITQLKINATTSLNVRTEPHTGSNIVGSTSTGQIYSFSEEKTGEGFTWYRIAYGGGHYWIASAGSTWVEKIETTQNLNTYYQVNSAGDIQHVYLSDLYNIATLTIGKAPSYLKTGTRYWSFDGNYFYTDLKTMLNDYRAKNRNNALNANSPYFAYYQYLPSRSLSGYTATDFNNIVKSWEITGQPANNVTYVNSNCTWTNANRTGLSKMFNTGASFIKAQEQYSINALQAFAKAMNESDRGRSSIAFLKNNLFGMGAIDSNPCGGAYKYATPEESILDYAKTLSGGSGGTGYSSGYNNPWDWRYAGGHYGNKGSGLNVNYAGDPYWGEKQAAISYALDKSLSGKDNESSTLGIKLSGDAIDILKEPSSSSAVIYRAQNYDILKVTNQGYLIPNMAFVVIDKIYVTEGGKQVGYYKVYTDPPLNVSRNTSNAIATSTQYSFTNSWGYIKETNLYVANDLAKAPTFNISGNLEVSQYTNKNNIDFLSGVSVSDADTNIMSKVTYTTNLNTATLGNYTITYSVTNSKGRTATATRTITVVPNKPPVIHASDKTVSTGSTFNYTEGVTAIDPEEGDITSKIKYSGTVNTTIEGKYPVTYSVTDSNNNTVSRTITIIVEKATYTNKTGTFYLHELKYDEKTKTLNFRGFQRINGINNLPKTGTYDLILTNQLTKQEIIIPLNSWDEGVPFVANEPGLQQSGAWFTSSIDLKGIPAGDYAMQIRARINTYQAITDVSNRLFSKEITTKFNSDNRGYFIRTNTATSEMKIELFVRDSNLITTKINPTTDNMRNQIHSASFSGNNLKLMGLSHNTQGNYSKSTNVERWIYLENIVTKEIVRTYSVGYIDNGPFATRLPVSDGFDKTRAWYDATMDISTLERGRYAIIVRTKTGTIDDHGEIYDYQWSQLPTKISINGKTYSVVRNNTTRYRLELVVE